MPPGDTHNELTGIVIGPAIMGRDVTVTLPAEVPLAMSGLPAASPAFTGRREAIAKVLRVLEPRTEESAVAVTAVGGMGGVGKTELAVQAARIALARGWFPGGVLFADLFGYDNDRMRDPAQVLAGMLRALGVPDEYVPPDPDERVRMYRSILAEFARRERRVLVVADNVGPDQPVSMLLPTDGGCAAIVTSRHTLAMLDARLLDLNVLSHAEAEEMLRRVVEVAHPGDTRVTGAGELVDMCGRLPLAIRIVGALLADERSLQPAQLAVELAELTPLEGLSYGGEAVAKAFARSYGALAEEQQWTFRLLSINPGPDISTPAAAALTGLKEPAVRQILKDLARAHLIERGDGYGRWRMHDLMRQYATGLEDEHAEDDRREQALSRLLEFYLNGVVEAKADSDWLEDELPNLTAAVHAAAIHRPEMAMALPVLLAGFLERRRLFDDWLAIIQVALESAHTEGHKYGEAHLLSSMGRALGGLLRFDESITAHEKAVEVFGELGERFEEGVALNLLHNALNEAHWFDYAVVIGERAMALFRELGDRSSEAVAMSNTGLALAGLGRYAEALVTHRRAVATHHELGDLHSEGIALNNLAIALAGAERFDEAASTFQRSLGISRELGDRPGEGTALGNLANAFNQARRPKEAIAASERALDIFRELGDRYSEGMAALNLGVALEGLERWDQAIAKYEDAAAIFRESGGLRDELKALTNLGDLLVRLERHVDAVVAYQDALSIARQFDSTDDDVYLLRKLNFAMDRLTG